ncbi:uncharacterized protein LOC128961563 [Oppia nitens]|uniref:uncharacterized protein LOC128961563 n=1 Tax=Oppia nitens TaxID=1686743 RepID=UPI0023DBDB84|nr:uncharacterized protein LOC128961563 [Oppia nitens]
MKMCPKVSKQLSPGDIIGEDKPLVYIVDNKFKDKHCNHCFKECQQLRRCSHCWQLYYCGKDCQSMDWKSYHKNECQIFKQLGKYMNSYTMEVKLCLRLYFLLKMDQSFANQKHQQFDGTEVSLNDIDLKVDELEGDNHYMREFREVRRHLKDCDIVFDGNDLLHCLTFIQTHRNHAVYPLVLFGCSHETFDIGLGLYTRFLTLRHSCCPNSALIEQGETRIQLRVLKPLTAGQEVLISYFSIDKNRKTRKAMLKRLFIDCQCDKCENNIDKDVDYELMDEMTEASQSIPNTMFMIMTGSSQSSVFKKWLSRLPKFLSDLDVVFGEYGSIKTLALRNILDTLVANRCTDKELIQSLLKTFVKAIDITHGPKHYYKDMSMKTILSSNYYLSPINAKVYVGKCMSVIVRDIMVSNKW